MTTLLNGFLGGLIVGLAAALAVEFVGESPSATAALDALFGRGSGSSRSSRIVAWAAYGTLAGAAFVALELYVLGLISVPPTAVAAYGPAVAWAALLFVLAALAYRVALHLPMDLAALVDLLAFHLVFGLGLGVWIRTTWIT